MDTNSCIIRGGTVVCADRVLPDCDVVVETLIAWENHCSTDTPVLLGIVLEEHVGHELQMSTLSVGTELPYKSRLADSFVLIGSYP